MDAIWNQSTIDKSINKILYGIDLDSNSINACRRKLSKHTIRNKYLEDNFISTNSLVSLQGNLKNLKWESLKKSLSNQKGFDILIANPPWGADLSLYKNQLDKKEYRTLNGQFDSFELFIELALKIVKENGIFSFIIPDSVLNHGKVTLRKLLLENTQIRFIARLGEKIFPNVSRGTVILICEQRKPNKNQKIDCFRLSPVMRNSVLSGELRFEDAEKNNIHKIRQSRFLKNRELDFNIDLKDSETDLLKKFSTKNIIGDYISSYRGVELSKSGRVIICPNCGIYLPYPKNPEKKCESCRSPLELLPKYSKNIVTKRNDKGALPFITGSDIKRYSCTHSKFILPNKTGINYKSKKLYEGTKILVRKTGVGISASLDYSNAYVPQVVYILKFKENVESILTPELVLALLNSRAYYYYLTKNNGENEWRSHPYLTQSQILNLPIPNLIKNKHKEVINEISSIIKTEIGKGSNLSDKSDARIEYLISKLLKLSQKDYELIYETINQSQELLPVKALKNIQIKDIFHSIG